MIDVPYPDDLERLQGNIREEIATQLGMARVELDRTTVDNLVTGIATNIDYAFEFHWRPRWVKDGDAHRWTEGAESDEPRHFVECLACKRITVHSSTDEAAAWYANHRQVDHD